MGGGKKALILVFNKTVKNRFIRLLFQQPAAEPQKNVSPYISRRYRRPAKDSQDKMVLTILSRNSINLPDAEPGESFLIFQEKSNPSHGRKEISDRDR